MTHAPHSIALKFTQCKQCDHETFNKVQAMNQNQSQAFEPGNCSFSAPPHLGRCYERCHIKAHVIKPWYRKCRMMSKGP